MKKLIAMLLLLAMVVMMAVSCGKAADPADGTGTVEDKKADTSAGVTDLDAMADPLAYMARIYAASSPTKAVATWTQRVGKRGDSAPMTGTSTLLVGKVGGQYAAQYTEQYDTIADVGASNLIKTVTRTREYINGMVRDTDRGRAWRKGYNFSPFEGSIAPVLKAELIKSSTYADHVLTLVVSSEHAEEFFASFAEYTFAPKSADIAYDITMTIRDQGGTIAEVTLAYTAPAGTDVPEDIRYEAKIVYSYDLQSMTDIIHNLPAAA